MSLCFGAQKKMIVLTTSYNYPVTKTKFAEQKIILENGRLKKAPFRLPVDNMICDLLR